MREIVLDTETTGLDPIKGDRIIEIGCVELKNKIITGKKFHAYVNPKKTIDAESYGIHGIKQDFLDNQPIFADIAEQLSNFIQNDTLVIHNASFDMKFLNNEMRLCDRDILNNHIVDTIKLAKLKFPGTPASLDVLCRKFNIDTKKRTKHGALIDAELLAQVYIELCGGFQTNLLSGDERVEKIKTKSIESVEENNKSNINHNARAAYEKRIAVSPTKAETEWHTKYINTIPNAIWMVKCKQ